MACLQAASAVASISMPDRVNSGERALVMSSTQAALVSVPGHVSAWRVQTTSARAAASEVCVFLLSVSSLASEPQPIRGSTRESKKYGEDKSHGVSQFGQVKSSYLASLRARLPRGMLEHHKSNNLSPRTHLFMF